MFVFTVGESLGLELWFVFPIKDPKTPVMMKGVREQSVSDGATPWERAPGRAVGTTWAPSAADWWTPLVRSWRPVGFERKQRVLLLWQKHYHEIFLLLFIFLTLHLFLSTPQQPPNCRPITSGNSSLWTYCEEDDNSGQRKDTLVEFHAAIYRFEMFNTSFHFRVPLYITLTPLCVIWIDKMRQSNQNLDFL